jgi:hypothetical protein
MLVIARLALMNFLAVFRESTDIKIMFLLQDKLMTAIPDSLLFKNNELWKASAVASLVQI